MLQQRILISVLFVLLVVFSAAAQTQPSPKMLAANELFKAQKWAEAASAYEAVTKDEPNNPRAWYQLGMSRFSLTEFAPAILTPAQ